MSYQSHLIARCDNEVNQLGIHIFNNNNIGRITMKNYKQPTNLEIAEKLLNNASGIGRTLFQSPHIRRLLRKSRIGTGRIVSGAALLKR